MVTKSIEFEVLDDLDPGCEQKLQGDALQFLLAPG
jgi:hypothetical protein